MQYNIRIYLERKIANSYFYKLKRMDSQLRKYNAQ